MIKMKTLNEMKVVELKVVAKEIALPGRSQMNKPDFVEALALLNVAGIEADGTIVYSGKVQVNEKELIKSMGEAIREVSKFNPILATEFLSEIKKGQSMRQALTVVANKNGELSVMVNDFIAKFYVPKKLKMPKKPQVTVFKADATRAQEDNGKIVAVENYDNLTDVLSADSGVMRTSTSDLIETLGTENVRVPAYFPFTDANGQTVMVKGEKDIELKVGKRLMVVNFGEVNEDTTSFINKLMYEGIWINEGGELKHYIYILRSNSQARQLKGMFMLNDGHYTVSSFLRKLGHEPIIYTKFKDGVYTLDTTKPDKRKGLSGTNTSKLFSFEFGTDVSFDGNDIIITGGAFTIRVVRDLYAKVSKGMYKVVDKDNKVVATLDAAEHPQKFVVGDGQCFFGRRVAEVIGYEAGQFGAAFQHRTASHIKGMFVGIHNLENYYAEDFVVFDGSVKGNIVESIKCGHKMEIRMARLNPSSKTNKKFTMFPYQFMHTLNMSAEDMAAIVMPHLGRVKDMLTDYSIMEEYLGIDRVREAVEEMEESDAQEFLDNKLSTSLSKAMFVSNGMAYADAYLKRNAFKLISLMVRRWITGQIPVQGSYKYLIQDPLAILEAAKMNIRDEEGDLIVPSHVGIQADDVVVSMWDEAKGHEVCHEGKIALFRNPAITQGEASPVTAVYNKDYAVGMKAGFYANLAIVSCHDFALVRQGGADVDGDTSFVCLEPSIINSVHNNEYASVIDRYFTTVEGEKVFKDGCPWPAAEGAKDIPMINPTLITSQDGYNVSFTKEQYTDQLVEELHRVEKHWVMATLQANKIGYLTNAATTMADMKRRMVYAIREGKDVWGRPLTQETHDEYMKLIPDYQAKIDWIRYAQGWEIDRAKHGGAYESHLKEELAFVTDKTRLPELCSFVKNQETGERKWIKPVWLDAFNKCETADEIVSHYEAWVSKNNKRAAHTQSVIGKHFVNMINWYKGFKVEFEAMASDIMNNNLIGFLASLQVDRQTFDVIANGLAPVATYYKTNMSNIMVAYRNQKHQLDSAFANRLISQDQYKHYSEQLEAGRSEQTKMLIEDTRNQVASLDVVDQYPDHIVGYVSYIMTYSQVSKGTNNKSVSFAWVVTEEKTLAALKRATELVSAAPSTEEIIEENFTVQAMVPKALVEQGITKETIMKNIAVTKHHGVYAMRKQSPAGDFKYYLFVVNPTTKQYEPMGEFYMSIVEKHFMGHDKIKINLDEVYVSGKHTINISGSKMIKA
jgi:RNA dependent RNA polymerase